MTPNVFDAPQLDLLGGQAEPAQTHRLFFALLPDEAMRAQFAQVAATLKAEQPGLRPRWVTPARYHATVHFLGDHPMLREDIVQAAARAGDMLRADTFDWVLDYVASFHGREPPCVLRSTEVPEPLQKLWQDLREGLIRTGQGTHLSRAFTPHVTLGYSRGGLLPSTPVGPLHWRVRQLALIHSVVGRGDHVQLRQWQLSG